MYAVFNIALPFFALIFTGYAAGWRGNLSGAISGLNTFVFYFALPALLIVKIAEAPVEALLDPKLIAAYYGAGLLLFAVVFGLGKMLFPGRNAVHALRALGGTFSNVGFVGLPLVILAFGAEAAPPAVVVLVLDMVVIVGLTVALIEADLGGGGGFRRAALTVGRGLIRNPLIVASFVGVALALLGIKISEPLQVYGTLLGNAAAPCALFALGVTLAGRPVAQIRDGAAETAFVCFVKLVVHPALVWLFAAVIFQLPPLWTAVLVVDAALPLAANVYLLAERYRTYQSEASAAVLVSTVLALVTVSLVLSHYYPLAAR